MQRRIESCPKLTVSAAIRLTFHPFLTGGNSCCCGTLSRRSWFPNLVRIHRTTTAVDEFESKVYDLLLLDKYCRVHLYECPNCGRLRAHGGEDGYCSEVVLARPGIPQPSDIVDLILFAKLGRHRELIRGRVFAFPCPGLVRRSDRVICRETIMRELSRHSLHKHIIGSGEYPCIPYT